MPLISSFYGILIYIYQEKGETHSTPHVHAGYAEYDMSIDFDANVLAGSLPNKQKKLVEAWVLIHQDELKAAWKAYNEFGELIKIKGLE
ncbi:MAG: DUF4160 domain-containing protein [Clostridiales Family XIII bacterium]|jgi:hypothetical protein|nr:DUF4160 domain-containing protein [Clostridiales Family XIII bacterium]